MTKIVKDISNYADNLYRQATIEGYPMSTYTDNGYENRRDYLECLADDMGVDKQTVFALASVLGPSEDFDGLVSHLEDIGDGF